MPYCICALSLNEALQHLTFLTLLVTHHCSLLLFRDAGFHILITNYQMLVSDEKHLRSIKWQYMVLDEAQAIKSSQRYGTLSSILLFIKIPYDTYKKIF